MRKTAMSCNPSRPTSTAWSTPSRRHEPGSPTVNRCRPPPAPAAAAASALATAAASAAAASALRCATLALLPSPLSRSRLFRR